MSEGGHLPKPEENGNKSDAWLAVSSEDSQVSVRVRK